MGAAATAGGPIVDRRERHRLPAHVVRAWDTRGRSERGTRLPHLHRWIGSTAVGLTFHNVAARLHLAAAAYGVDRRACLGRGGCLAAQLLSPVRRGSDR